MKRASMVGVLVVLAAGSFHETGDGARSPNSGAAGAEPASFRSIARHSPQYRKRLIPDVPFPPVSRVDRANLHVFVGIAQRTERERDDRHTLEDPQVRSLADKALRGTLMDAPRR